MKDVSFFKRLRLMRHYWLLIKRNREEITDKKNGFNLRVDNAGRVYTVLNCPKEVASYGPSLAEKYIKEYIGKVEPMFINMGLIEYIGIRKIEQVTELDFLIVFGYKGFDTASFLNRALLTGISVVTATLLIFFLLF